MKPDAQSAGRHLLIDAITTLPREKLNDLTWLAAEIRELIGVLEMEPIGEPLIQKVPLSEDDLATDEDEGGVSFIQMLSTSHVSIHTWPLRSRFSMDVFSCNEFDEGACLSWIIKNLAVESYTSHSIGRRWAYSMDQGKLDLG